MPKLYKVYDNIFNKIARITPTTAQNRGSGGVFSQTQNTLGTGEGGAGTYDALPKFTIGHPTLGSFPAVGEAERWVL
jgi:hypothetical protein